MGVKHLADYQLRCIVDNLKSRVIAPYLSLVVPSFAWANSRIMA